MKKNIRAVTSWFGNHWRGVIVAILVTVLAATTLGLQLTTLVPGQNQFETATLNSIQSFPAPWHRAVNAPYTIPAYLAGKALDNPLHGARIVSVVYGLLAMALLFYVIRMWFNIRVATVGALLFITGSWVLHITHMASPLILLIFGPLLAVAPLAWLLSTKKHRILAYFTLAAALAVTAYIPYMPWIVAIALGVIIFYEKRLVSGLKTWQVATAAGIYGVILLPLFVSLVRHPGQLHELLGIPAIMPTLTEYWHQFAYTISMILFRSAPLPELHLGRLPMLDIFSAAMFALGLYYFATRHNNRRSVILFVSMALLLLLVPLTPLYQLNATIFVAFVYICIISGIVELLNQWFVYFPRNPWARNFGVALLVVAIGFASFYHLERYFIAWPNTPETQAVYVVKSKE
jgi:hypothetical protein